MFTRIVSMQVKPNAYSQFIEVFENQVISTLRKQQGFKDELLFASPGGPEVVAISLWESKENAETYNRATYPEVLKTLAKFIEPSIAARSLPHQPVQVGSETCESWVGIVGSKADSEKRR